MTHSVAFDEAGNTGQNLTDPAQPTFVLASVDFSMSEAQLMVAGLNVNNAKEAHFTQLRKTRKGQVALEKFFESDLLVPERAKLFVADKSYMITAKIVDLLIEPMMDAGGVDIYEGGGNIALANLIQMVAPVFCSPARFQAMQSCFVDMVRTKDEASIDSFYDAVSDMLSECGDESFSRILEMIKSTRGIAKNALTDVGLPFLNPAVPLFISLCDSWGQQFQEPFDLVHDDSNTISSAKPILERWMNPQSDGPFFGYDRRVMQLPIRATGIRFSQSHVEPALQVADILAGSCAFWTSAVRGKSQDMRMLEIIKNSPIPKLVAGKVWPSDAVTPEALGAVGGRVGGGIDGIVNAIN